MSLLALVLPFLLPQASAPTGSVPSDARDVLAGPAVAARPNILILMGDDMNGTDLASAATPNLDQLSNLGTTFERHYVFPQCCPTRYATLFGRLGRRDGIGQLIDSYAPASETAAPPLERITLVENLFSVRGYASAMFGKWHLGTNDFYDDTAPDLGPYNFGALTPLLQGFQTWRAGSMGNLVDTGGDSYTDWLRVDDGIFVQETGHAEEVRLAAFLDWWTATERPRFAYYAFNYSHKPFEMPPPSLLPAGYPVAANNRERFEAMIASMDFVIGEILDTIDLENTYVFFFGDNGPPPSIAIDTCPPFIPGPFPDCTKKTVFEPGIRTPLIVAGPDVVAGARPDALVSCVDLMATLGHLVGLPTVGEDSISYHQILSDPDHRSRDYVFIESFGNFRNNLGQLVPKDERAVIGPRYKLRRINGAEYVYDLQNDPGETTPVNLSNPGIQTILAELRAVADAPLDRSLQARN